MEIGALRCRHDDVDETADFEVDRKVDDAVDLGCLVHGPPLAGRVDEHLAYLTHQGVTSICGDGVLHLCALA